jgi:hypothetical protein
MTKEELWNDLRETLSLWTQGQGTERPEDECLDGIALVLELMLRAEERRA